ncbi:hypothetical protein HY214_03550 [Candidatus Roizmanbacteria bacterium]|nr:hypothetical protein [Candidatus Roizmanbacteria bacterium]
MTDIELLEQQAIEEAVNSRFDKAIDLNKKIVALDRSNLPALLRLGFSSLQLRRFDDANKYYYKALKLQPSNNVAKENLERIKILQSKSGKKNKRQPVVILDPNLFLEIPGRTKSVALVNLGQKNVLAQLTIGQKVEIINKRRRVEIRAAVKDYVGSLPDDLSRRLILFLRAKSKYAVFIKEANLSRIIVFIKEVSRGKTVASYLSFPQNMQSHIAEINSEKEADEEKDAEDVNEIDIDKLAEHLANEDKEYLPYRSEEIDEEAEE